MTCPIWGTKASIGPADGRDGSYVDSPRAGGKYFISDTAQIVISDLSDREKAKITTWIIDQHNLGNRIPEITSYLINESKNRRELRVDERLYRFLNYIKLSTPRIGQVFLFSGRSTEEMAIQNALSAAWSESIDNSEVEFLRQCLNEEKLVKFNPSGTLLTLTSKGHLSTEWNINEEIDQAFIAMWFSEETENAYHLGIHPAISESGFRPLRIDQKEHNNKIDDEIVAEIRKSRFVVADFTCGAIEINGELHTIARGGVYYEAGFAQCLGIPVIWCCRKDQIETVHFDTRQYNHIVWETPEELRRALKNRIEAVIGTGPRQA